MLSIHWKTNSTTMDLRFAESLRHSFHERHGAKSNSAEFRLHEAWAIASGSPASIDVVLPKMQVPDPLIARSAHTLRKQPQQCPTGAFCDSGRPYSSRTRTCRKKAQDMMPVFASPCLCQLRHHFSGGSSQTNCVEKLALALSFLGGGLRFFHEGDRHVDVQLLSWAPPLKPNTCAGPATGYRFVEERKREDQQPIGFSI